MKVFVTGVAGQLGHDVMNELASRGYVGVGTDLAESYSGIQDGSYVTTAEYVSLDITNKESVMNIIKCVNPDVVVHCAAWTAVDLAEDEDKQAKVKAINVDGTQNIADACKEVDAKMVYISTDYVYFIVRIAWVFGKNGNNFIKTMLNVGKKFDTLRVVNDQIGTPTYTFDLARLLVDMIETDKYGYYHATNEGGYISWYDFACEIFKQAGYTTKVNPVTTEEYGLSKAARPFNSRLDKSKLAENGFKPLPTWQDALARYLKELA